MFGAPSLQMVSDGDTFTAGVFTQVNGLQPGATYKASAGWFAPTHPPDDYFCRKLGIDPRGGTNPQAAEVVWGPIYCGPGRLVNYPSPGPNIDVSAVAQSSTVTVFAYVQHTYSTGMNFIFLDAVGLYEDASAPRQAPPTAVPPTALAGPGASRGNSQAGSPPPTHKDPSSDGHGCADGNHDCYDHAYLSSNVHIDDHPHADRDLHADGYAYVNAATAVESHARCGERCRNRCRCSHGTGVSRHALRRPGGAGLRGSAGHRADREQATIVFFRARHSFLGRLPEQRLRFPFLRLPRGHRQFARVCPALLVRHPRQRFVSGLDLPGEDQKRTVRDHAIFGAEPGGHSFPGPHDDLFHADVTEG